MRDWNARLESRTVTPEQAVACVRPGSRVFVGSGCAEPVLLVTALAARPDVVDVEVLHITTVGNAPYARAEQTRRFRANAFFIGSNVREAVAHGSADYTPMFLSEIPALFRSHRIRLDVALVTVSPPDAHGYCSLGISVDVVRSAVDTATVVVAEINPTMPRTHGDTFLHVNDVDIFVHNTAPILETVPAPAGDIDRAVGRLCASLIPDGATLQMGIGGIPNAVLASLGDRHDLGIHTEMFSDGLIDLIEGGVVTCRRKTLRPGKAVTSFVRGSRRLYDYVHDNPFFEFRPTEFVNDPFVIARNERMISINSALQVDLTGQVCADSIGTRFYSGIGGQVDFIRGAARSPGGRSILAMESTAKQGTISRIVSTLSEGAGVVTTRGDVHTVVTEYGIAELRGRTVRERALSLISIAHPDFRSELLAAARHRRVVSADQVPWPERGRPYPVEYESNQVFDGTEVFFRPLRPADERLLRDFFYSLSPDAVFQRFRRPLRELTTAEIQDQCSLDYDTEMAIAGIVREGEGERIVAVARAERDRSSGVAEASIAVAEDFQGRGLGTWLFRHIAEIARTLGAAAVSGTVLANNTRMLNLFHRFGAPVESVRDGDTWTITLRFAVGDPNPPPPV